MKAIRSLFAAVCMFIHSPLCRLCVPCGFGKLEAKFEMVFSWRWGSQGMASGVQPWGPIGGDLVWMPVYSALVRGQWWDKRWVEGALQGTPRLVSAESSVPPHLHTYACSGPASDTHQVPLVVWSKALWTLPHSLCALWTAPGNSHVSIHQVPLVARG